MLPPMASLISEMPKRTSEIFCWLLHISERAKHSSLLACVARKDAVHLVRHEELPPQYA